MGIGGIGASTKRRVEIHPYRSQSPPLLHQPPPPPPQFSPAVYRAILLAAAVGLMYVVLGQSDSPPPQLPISPPSSPREDSTQTNLSPERESEASLFHMFKSEDLTSQKWEKDGNELELILRKASIEDRKTVIITTVNAAWMEPSSLFDLFLESFKIGNETQKFLENLVVVAMDQEAYHRCKMVHRHCFALTTEGVDFSGEAKFRSGDYLEMMWRRIDFLRSVLEMGYSFIFSDVDIAWMRDPFPRLYEEGDIQMACDVFVFNSTSRWNFPNAGFVYAKSNPRSIQFYKYWVAKREAGKHDQDVFYKIKHDPFMEEIGLDLRFLDTAYFSGLCEPSRDLDEVVTMHANCCTKLKSKIHDIRMVIEDWKNYKMGGPNKWSVPRICGVRKADLEKMKALARAAHA
ncbi:uncharacterized protein At4g15970-like [Salvia miltiorrhiza]|uniref:uncharacterized protein At4g15970-like n=1 Tax=Salvia miltiorrhiza TaxID=226208 RepID=UPI0025ACBD17|nr:uncharacterized protein At4g15970-like [Salvia miltiorrhiza]